jgi:hypothetical protein
MDSKGDIHSQTKTITSNKDRIYFGTALRRFPGCSISYPSTLQSHIAPGRMKVNPGSPCHRLRSNQTTLRDIFDALSTAASCAAAVFGIPSSTNSNHRVPG